jgi:hypothetical protein
MEAELAHLFNGNKWSRINLNLELSNKNNNRQVFNFLHLSSIDVEESRRHTRFLKILTHNHLLKYML